MLLNLLLLLLGVIGVVFATELSTTVLTTEGIANGGSFEGLRYWKNIPYAQPPVADLRFANPQPVGPYANGTRDFSAFTGVSCFQFGKDGAFGAEDCLYLDVYAPGEASPAFPKGYPVVVWIHGGAFLIGSKDSYIGASMAFKGAIVVAINYRLNAFGFLRTSNSSAGNYGFRDQVAALQWVKNNANAFGGDPNLITIAGQSAGANSVKLHMTSPLSKGLFQRAISQSPMALSYYAEKPDAVSTTQHLASKLSCAWDDLACLRGKSAEELVGAMFLLYDDCKKNRIPAYAYDIDRSYWTCGVGPQIESGVIPFQMSKAFTFGAVHRVPWLIGTAWNEGLVDSDATYNPLREGAAGLYANHGQNMENSQYLYNRYLNEVIDHGDYSNISTHSAAYGGGLSQRARSVLNIYPYGFNENYAEMYPNLYNGVYQYNGLDANYIWNALYHDRMYFCAARSAVRSLHAALKQKFPQVYFYVFKQVQQSTKDIYRNDLQQNAEAAVSYGFWSYNLYATHSNDIPFLFPDPTKPWTDSNEASLSDRMTSSWINFAVSGNPGKGVYGSEVVGRWDRYYRTADNFTVLESPVRGEGVVTRLRRRQCNFWERTGFTL